MSHGVTYGFTMEFFAKIVKDECKHNTNGRFPIITISKEDKEGEYWPRITKDKVKNARITVDWSKWVDEDEESEAPAVGGDFDPSQMNNFGGAGGMPGGMEGMMGGMGAGAPGMNMGGPMGGAGGMDMEALMKQMGGMGGAQGMPDSDDEDEEEEAACEPKSEADALGDLDA